MAEARDEAGNVWEVDAQGNPVRLIQAAGAGQILADPAAQYEAPRAAAAAASAQADAQVDAATIDAQIELARAQASKARAEADKANAGGRTLTPAQQAVDSAYAQEYIDWRAAGGFAGLENNLKLLEGAVSVLEGADTLTGPVIGRLPKFIQQSINPKAPDVRADVERVIQQSLRQILGGQFAQKEAEQLFARSFDPTQQEGSNIDRIKATIAELRARGQAKESAAQHFEQTGTLTGLPNALTMPRVTTDSGLTAAGAGATTTLESLPPAYQQAYQAFARAGGYTPEQYADFRASLDRQFFPDAAPDRATYLEEGRRILDTLEKGGTLNLTVPGVERRLSDEGLFGTSAFSEQAVNNAVSNPVGAAVVGAADMSSFGALLDREATAALSEAQPVGTMVGQMAGAVTGTGALGSGVRGTVGQLAPQLLQGGARGALARDVATDAAYSGIYGAATGQDPLASAGLGAGGSLAGRGVGTGLGAAVSGPRLERAVEVLRSRNVPMTVPQQLGGFAKSIEDKATSLPLVGDMIRARRMEGLNAFNREAFQDAGAPIGATVRDIGEEGVQQLTDQIGSAYDQATAGVTVPLDGQFLQDFAGAVGRGQQLPPDLRRRLGQVLDARVQPIADAGELTGDQYQQAFRALKKTRANPPQQFGGFEQDYRNSVTGVMDALEGQITRGAPQVAPALNAANAANRNARTIERAVKAAAGGSQSGEAFMFTPNQLQRAGLATEAKYPGVRPFAELADAGQRVLPSRVPDSGTAGRLATMAMPAALGGTGAGVGFMAGGDAESAQTGATYGALSTALAVLGGTKTGQKALQKVLIDRSPRAVALGKAIRNRRGLFGSASLPLLISDY